MLSPEGRRRISEVARELMKDPARRAALSELHKGKPNKGAHVTSHLKRDLFNSACPWCLQKLNEDYQRAQELNR